MTCSMLILLWVRDEYSVDAFHANGDRLYSVYGRYITNGKVSAGYSTPGLLADELKKNIPETEDACAFSWTVSNTFSAGDKILKEDANHAGPGFFTMFSYPLLEGNPQNALSTPVSMAISRKMAIDFFGSPAAAIGKTLRYENQKDFTVSAVFEDLPHNVSERFDCLINWSAFIQENEWLKQWGNNGPSTYVLLRPGSNPAHVQKMITHFLDAYLKQGPSYREELHLQRFSEQYLYSSFVDGYPSGGGLNMFNCLA